MKTNIKMRVTPEQSRRVQEICFKNNIAWHGVKAFNHLRQPYIYVYENTLGYDYKESSEYFNDHENIEIDADLFIRINGTCEETFKEQQSYNDSDLIIKDDNIYMIGKAINKHNEIKDGINEWAKQFNDIEQKLKKKNEILKKAKVKRKNQREELNKLNLKLQKCISLEEHDLKMKTVLNEKHKLEAENIEMGKLVNLNKSALDLAVITKELAMNEIERKNNEIEKLKAVIEYLESKVK